MYTLSPFCYSCLSIENLQCIKTVDFDNVSLLEKFELCISNGKGKLKDLNYICIICCSALRIAYKFKTMVLSNQNIIKGYVKKLQPDSKRRTVQAELQVHVLKSNSDKEPEDSEIVYLSDSDSIDSDIIEISCEKFSKRNGETSNDNFEIFIKDEKIETIDLYHDEFNNGVRGFSNLSIDCRICAPAAKSAPQQSYQSRSDTSSSKFACTLCNKTFNRLDKLTYHKIFHDNSKSVKCKFCNRLFTSARTLKLHIKHHKYLSQLC